MACSIMLPLYLSNTSYHAEPTSALDPESTTSVERLIMSELRSSEAVLKAIVWITHSAEQGHRVGTRHLHLTADGCREEIVQEGV